MAVKKRAMILQRDYARTRILILLRYLEEYSDEEHPVSTEALCALLQSRNICAERRAVYKDIAALTESGVDIVHTRSPQNGYFIAKRSFEVPEVRLLLDAVDAAPFITSKKTEELSKKLCELLSRYQMEGANRLYMEQRLKFKNEEIYYNIDAAHTAVFQKKKLSFTYYHRIIEKNGIHLDDGKKFILSPYALMWVNDKYYLAGNYHKYDNITNYRLDRMRHVSVLREDARSFEEVSSYRGFFDTADYIKKSFNMYNGEPEQITFCCSKQILEAVIDRLGEDVTILGNDSEKFTVRASAYISEGLIEWILQFGEQMLVVSPQSLKEQVIEKVKALNKIYQI